MQKRMFWIGVTLTAVYVTPWLVWIGLKPGTFSEMPPSSWGDFMAGVFGPLSLLWVVLGFLQQGEELRLQAKELQNSVEQQRKLVEVTEAQRLVEIDRIQREEAKERDASSPRFMVSGPMQIHSNGRLELVIRASNIGDDAFDLVLIKPASIMAAIRGPTGHLATKHDIEIIAKFETDENRPEFALGFSCKDKFSRMHYVAVRLLPEERAGNIGYKMTVVDEEVEALLNGM